MSNDKCFNATFRVGVVLKSFVDKAKFLCNCLQLSSKTPRDPRWSIKADRTRLSIPIEEVLFWFDLEKKMPKDCLACKNIGLSNLPLSLRRTTTHLQNYAVNMNLPYSTSLSLDTLAHQRNVSYHCFF